MNGESLRGAAHVIGRIAQGNAFRDVAGEAVAGFTTSSFAVFALLLVAALVGQRIAVRDTLITATVGGLGAGAAAAIGLLVKILVAEPRPCQVDPSLAVDITCPAPGDWSFPSNHAVVAGALALTLVVIARSSGRLWIASAAVTLALGIATSRVVLGVHHWWDVIAGLALGVAVAAVLIATLAPPTRRWLDARGHRPRTPSPVR